jgi:hypothetical protein
MVENKYYIEFSPILLQVLLLRKKQLTLIHVFALILASSYYIPKIYNAQLTKTQNPI